MRVGHESEDIKNMASVFVSRVGIDQRKTPNQRNMSV